MLSPPPPARRVHTVRLRAPEMALVRRGALLLEDALHTASIPSGDTGRLLLVHQLNLGIIHSHQSAATLALAIEKQLHQLTLSAVHGADPAAAYQPAVYFHDALEPYLYLALRLASGQPVLGWYWAIAAPPWQPHLSRDDALRQILLGLTQQPLGPVAVAPLLDILQRHGALDALLSSLGQQDGQSLLQLSGWAFPPFPSSPAPFQSAEHETPPNPRAQPVDPHPLTGNRPDLPSHPLPPLPQPWIDLLSTWIRHWGTDDPRTLWLAASALVVAHPTQAADQRLGARSHHLIHQLTHRPQALNPTPAPPPSEDQSPFPQSPSSKESAPNASPANHSTNPPKPSPLTTHAQPSNSPPNAAPSNTTHSPTPPLPYPPYPLTSHPSPFGGLYLCLPALHYLGLPAFLATYPHLADANLPHHLLYRLAQRLGALDDDPVLLAIAALTPPPARCPFVAPPQWYPDLTSERPLQQSSTRSGQSLLFDYSGRLPLALWGGAPPPALQPWQAQAEIHAAPAPAVPGEDFDWLIASWLTALRRWCRRYAHIGLHDLVCRSALVSATRTHLDLEFDPAQGDIRIRRAGLDLNPGWLPWLGWVVQFHYTYRE